jgi:hypothetical protein
MTRTSYDATAGQYDSAPPTSVAVDGNGSFMVESMKDNTWSGCGGDVVYTFTDGTTLNLHYYTSYYYGVGDNSSYTSGFGGPRANRYALTGDPNTQGSHGGAGKAVTWPLTITYT